MTINFKSIGIIGLGLIGGSIAKALRNSDFEGEIYAFGRCDEAIKHAYDEGVIDNERSDLSEYIKLCDLIILATPIGTYGNIIKEIKEHLQEGCVITDVGSVKTYVHETVEEILNGSHRFIGGHPMAGSEKSGYSASKAHLLENAYYFLTVGKDRDVINESLNEHDNDINDTELLKLWQLIKLIGGKPHLISPQAHDYMVARTSHLPHLSASMLVQNLGEKGENLINYVGGGFRDTTRVASGDPKLWCDIIHANKTQILSAMEDMMIQFTKCKTMIESGEIGQLEVYLNEAREARESIPKHLVDNYDKEHAIYVDIQDQPGMLAKVTGLMAENVINIKDIEIIHAREHVPGVLKVGYYSAADLRSARIILESAQFNCPRAFGA